MVWYHISAANQPRIHQLATANDFYETQQLRLDLLQNCHPASACRGNHLKWESGVRFTVKVTYLAVGRPCGLACQSIGGYLDPQQLSSLAGRWLPSEGTKLKKGNLKNHRLSNLTQEVDTCFFFSSLFLVSKQAIMPSSYSSMVHGLGVHVPLGVTPEAALHSTHEEVLTHRYLKQKRQLGIKRI